MEAEHSARQLAFFDPRPAQLGPDPQDEPHSVKMERQLCVATMVREHGPIRARDVKALLLGVLRMTEGDIVHALDQLWRFGATTLDVKDGERFYVWRTGETSGAIFGALEDGDI